MITSSNILLALLINYLIECNKSKELPKKSAMELLCYIFDCIELTKCRQFSSIDDFKANISLSVSSETIYILLSKFFGLLLEHASNLDAFFDIKVKLSNIFEEDPSADYNNLSGPTRLTKESPVGVFIRCFLCELENLSFENYCVLYDNYKEFIASIDSMNSAHFHSVDRGTEITSKSFTVMQSVTLSSWPHILGTTDNAMNCHPDSTLDEPSKLLFYIQQAIYFQDMTTAEELLHQYYDYNGSSIFQTLPQPSSPYFSSTYQNNMKINNLLQYILSSHINYNYINRHQQSLLHLTVMWLKGECKELAIISLEEALKIAHQRDDHISVTKALLLMYEIFSDEDFLLRCIDRCVTYECCQLSSQATISLAKHRSMKSLWCQIDFNQILGSISSQNINDMIWHFPDPPLWDLKEWVRGQSYSPQITWLLLLSGIYGDVKISSIISKSHDITSLEQELIKFSASLATSTNPLGLNHPNKPNNNKDSIYQECFLNYEEYIESLLSMKKVSSSLWIRYNVMDMAIHDYKSILSSSTTKYYSNDDLLIIACSLIRLHMEQIDIEVFKSMNHSFNESPSKEILTKLDMVYEKCMSMVVLLKTCFPAMVPSVFERSITLTRDYITIIHHSYYNEHLLLTHILIDRCLALTSQNQLIAEDDETTVQWSELHAKLHLLAARLIERDNSIAAAIEYERIENACGHSEESLQCKYIAMALRANLMKRDSFPRAHRRQLAFIEAIHASRLYGYPLIEQYISNEGIQELEKVDYKNLSTL